MPNRETARVFKIGRIQAVRIPKRFRFAADEGFIERDGDGAIPTRACVSEERSAVCPSNTSPGRLLGYGIANPLVYDGGIILSAARSEERRVGKEGRSR